MYNRKIDFLKQEQVGSDDGTPIFGDVVVYSRVLARSEQVTSNTEREGGTGEQVRITRKLMVKPKLNGVALVINTDMTVRIDGKLHDIKGVKPVEGASPKPVYIEVMAEERIA